MAKVVKEEVSQTIQPIWDQSQCHCMISTDASIATSLFSPMVQVKLEVTSTPSRAAWRLVNLILHFVSGLYLRESVLVDLMLISVLISIQELWIITAERMVLEAAMLRLFTLTTKVMCSFHLPNQEMANLEA